MKKEITNEDLLQTISQQIQEINKHVGGIDEHLQGIDKHLEKVDERLNKTNEHIDDLTFFTKISFDDLGSKVENNTHSMTQLKETVGETNDHLCRVEVTMTQEFATTHLQQDRLTTQLGHHTKKIKKLETKRL